MQPSPPPICRTSSSCKTEALLQFLTPQPLSTLPLCESKYLIPVEWITQHWPFSWRAYFTAHGVREVHPHHDTGQGPLPVKAEYHCTTPLTYLSIGGHLSLFNCQTDAGDHLESRALAVELVISTDCAAGGPCQPPLPEDSVTFSFQVQWGIIRKGQLSFHHELLKNSYQITQPAAFPRLGILHFSLYLLPIPVFFFSFFLTYHLLGF